MKMRVKLSTPEDIRRFVEIASRYKQDMELVLGRYIVDAKSILGILSLDLSKPLDLIVSDYVDGLSPTCAVSWRRKSRRLQMLRSRPKAGRRNTILSAQCGMRAKARRRCAVGLGLRFGVRRDVRPPQLLRDVRVSERPPILRYRPFPPSKAMECLCLRRLCYHHD